MLMTMIIAWLIVTSAWQPRPRVVIMTQMVWWPVASPTLLRVVMRGLTCFGGCVELCWRIVFTCALHNVCQDTRALVDRADF